MEGKIKNVFSIIANCEKKFVADNMLFYGLKPLLLVDSEIGPLFINCIMFPRYKTFVAIVP